MNNRIAMITGVGGMDGFYLSHLLLNKGYRVIGIVRRSANDNTKRLNTLKGSPNFNLVYGDVTDASNIARIVQEFQPSEFYHLAANSFVGCSWDSPNHMFEVNLLGTVNCLEALKQHKRDCRFYFAGSSEMYGDYVKRRGGSVILNEDSPMVAASPYGVSKVAGYQMTKVYRESYDMFATCGILFNHSAPLRGEEFFTRKVTSQLSRICWGLQDKLTLGNLDAFRDEGYSGDYVAAMYSMLQFKTPEDFVIATGKTHSCREWLTVCQQKFELDDDCVMTSDHLKRPNEVNVLIGDASKAKDLLGWQPSCDFYSLASKMCKYDFHVQSPQSAYLQQADEFIF